MGLGLRSSITNLFAEKPALIVVLGMHRSGTSAVTEALAATDLPLNLGSHLLGAKPQNPHGFFEDKRVIKANQDFYAAHDVAVMEPWRLPQEFSMQGTERMRIVFEKLRKEQINLIKDPRLCLTLPQWKAVWGKRVKVTYLHIWRHPAEVALSLAKRDGLSLAQAEKVWLTHVVAALQNADLKQSVFMMHADLLQEPVGELTRVAHEISRLSGMPFNYLKEVTIDPSLITAKTPGEITNPEVAELWRLLIRFNETQDREILNQITNNFKWF